MANEVQQNEFYNELRGDFDDKSDELLCLTN